MKRKYFLRGLGLGIVLSTLILCISYRASQSNVSVVDQAKELGMVFPEGTQPPDVFESPPPSAEPSVQENSSGAGVTAASTEKPAEISTPEPVSTPEPAETFVPEPAPTPEPVATPEPVKTPEPTKKPNTTKKPKATQKPAATQKPTATRNPVSSTGSKIRFKVRGGLLSSSVAREMKEAGIIENDKKFDEYLEKNGYARKIREGIYDIPKGASYYQLARIITRGK